MLKVENLTKSFRSGPSQVSVLRELNAEFPSGTFCTIVGASGSGKSTLLQLLGGLEPPDSGKVIQNSVSIGELSSNALADWRSRAIGFVFQSYHLLPELSALENVELPALIAGEPDLKHSEQLLREVGLSERQTHLPGELSGGEQQRVAIARALRRRPSILLADEPTGNLDAATATQITELLLQLHREEKTTLILVTHDESLARRGDHRFRLENGTLRPQ